MLCIIFSNRSQMTSNYVVGTERVAHKAISECVTSTFWHIVWFITEQVYGSMESIAFLYNYSSHSLILIGSRLTWLGERLSSKCLVEALNKYENEDEERSRFFISENDSERYSSNLSRQSSETNANLKLLWGNRPLPCREFNKPNKQYNIIKLFNVHLTPKYFFALINLCTCLKLYHSGRVSPTLHQTDFGITKHRGHINFHRH